MKPIQISQWLVASLMDHERDVLLSPDGAYRYILTRRWGDASRPADLKILGWVGLNPSTADAVKDDATIRRCVGFAKRWGYDAIAMLNLFAYRATSPVVMRRVVDPIGPLNDIVLETMAGHCDKLVLCWGAHGTHRNRSDVVVGNLRRLHQRDLMMFGLTKSGEPLHPVRLPNDRELIPYIDEALVDDLIARYREAWDRHFAARTGGRADIVVSTRERLTALAARLVALRPEVSLMVEFKGGRKLEQTGWLIAIKDDEAYVEAAIGNVVGPISTLSLV